MEMAELKVRDALHREESCGGHFREESQTEGGEAKRDDDAFSYVAAWEYGGPASCSCGHLRRSAGDHRVAHRHHGEHDEGHLHD